jgi:hypothetical protein
LGGVNEYKPIHIGFSLFFNDDTETKAYGTKKPARFILTGLFRVKNTSIFFFKYYSSYSQQLNISNFNN